jgi:hypothetical protein
VLIGLAVIAIWPGGWPIDPIIVVGLGWTQSWRDVDCC